MQHTKISYFHIQVFVQQKVFWFKISMDDHVTVTVINSRDDLLEKFPGLIFLQLQFNKTETSLRHIN